jgi:hypothetical protein
MIERRTLVVFMSVSPHDRRSHGQSPQMTVLLTVFISVAQLLWRRARISVAPDEVGPDLGLVTPEDGAVHRNLPFV